MSHLVYLRQNEKWHPVRRPNRKNAPIGSQDAAERHANMPRVGGSHYFRALGRLILGVDRYFHDIFVVSPLVNPLHEDPW